MFQRFFLKPVLATALLFFVGTQIIGCKRNFGAGDDKPSTEAPAKPNSPQGKLSNRISILTFNVENLFDTTHDINPNTGEDKLDTTYLPLATKAQIPNFEATCNAMKNANYKEDCLKIDWTQENLDKKLEKIADAIMKSNGVGPDIVLLQEVENKNVLTQLNQKYLQAANYKTMVLIEGDDPRGIDTAILSKFEMASEPILHRIEFNPPIDGSTNAPEVMPKSRGILEVSLKLPNGQVASVFCFHFPSGKNPTWQRQDAVNMLNKLIESKGPNAIILAGGDSNIVADDQQTLGFSLMSSEQYMAKNMMISHLVGCKQCKGSEYYVNGATKKGEWSFLKVLMFSKNLDEKGNAPGGMMLDKNSIKVSTAGKDQLKSNGTPNRYDFIKGQGVSDHLPVYGEILY